jgi:glycosyltransferase involved in cell wall biosynthesis
MKIALVVTDLSDTRIGGISRVATEVGANLAKLGHVVTAYVLARRDSQRQATYRGIRLNYIGPLRSLNPDYPVMRFSREAFRALCTDAMDGRFDVVQSFNLNAVGAISASSNLRRLALPLVVSNYETLMMDVRAKAAELTSLPSAKTLLQIAFEALLAATHERRYLARAERIVTEDENTRQALLRMGCRKELIRLIPSGVDVEAASQARAPAVDVRQGKAGPVIGYIGRVDPRKGTQYLIAAMPRVLRRFPDAVLFLAGGSRHEYDREVRSLIERLGLNSCVRLLGRIPGDILPYYKLADLVAIPSLSEGIPITLGEAMAAQIPVVITRLPGVTPFVQPSDLVHWADIANVDSLAEAILAGLTDPARTTRVARSFEFIRDFTWGAVARRHLAVYEEIVSARVAST